MKKTRIRPATNPHAKSKEDWTEWERIEYAANWRRIVQHELKRMWEKGEMKLDDGLKRYCGILPRKQR